MAGAPMLGQDAVTGKPVATKHAGQRLAEFAADFVAGAQRGAPREVPCGSCRECCWHSRIEVQPELGDDLTRLDTVQDADGTLVLRHREDGACVHLGPTGCSVREYRPAVCRGYDCRVVGAVGLVEIFANGHAMPGWFFELDTINDRALTLALRLGAMRVIKLKPGQFDIGEATRAAWTFAREHLAEVRSMVEHFDRMPPAERRRALDEFSRAAGT